MGPRQNPYFSLRRLKAFSPPSMIFFIASRTPSMSMAPWPANSLARIRPPHGLDSEQKDALRNVLYAEHERLKTHRVSIR